MAFYDISWGKRKSHVGEKDRKKGNNLNWQNRVNIEPKLAQTVSFHIGTT